ncbi:MAG: LysR family transcriptional regulator [Deltaproteobacteria bacterium]|nr:LysR family transcriptional regulator [Deltaproteobacteria bacterium]
MPSLSGASVANTNVNLLVALDALLQTGSVTEAAAAMGITQSSMSGTLAQLRQLFGDPLLVRSGRSMQPTPLALALVPDLRQGVQALERVLHGGPAFDPRHSDETFTLALPDRVELALFADLLQHLKQVSPHVGLQVVPWGRIEAPPQLATGGVDLCIGILVPPREAFSESWRTFPDPLPPGHHTQRLFDSGLSSLVRTGNPRVGRRMTLAAFCDLEHVLVTEQPGGVGIIDEVLAALGRRRRIAVRVPRHVLVGELIARTDLVATIDRRVAAVHAERYGLRCFKPPVKMPKGSFGMIWHARTHADPARRWLREQVALVAKRLA